MKQATAAAKVEPAFMSRAEAARFYRVSVAHLDNVRRQGREGPEFIRLGNRVLYPRPTR